MLGSLRDRLTWALIALSAGCADEGGATADASTMHTGGSGRDAGAAFSPAGRGMTGVGGLPLAGVGGSTADAGGATTGSGGAAGMSGSGGAAGMSGSGGAAGMMGSGLCCDDGDCLCHGEVPSTLTSERGPYAAESYTLDEACVHYPTDAEPPFAAVVFADGLAAGGGCFTSAQPGWGPLYASYGIVTMTVGLDRSDQPAQGAQALVDGLAALEAEHSNDDSPLFEKLAGRYGTSGFSIGGGATTYAAQRDATLRTNVAIMPFGPIDVSVTVPSLVICGASDGIAPCDAHGLLFYDSVEDSVPKMRVTVASGHSGQPSVGGGACGEVVLAFQKVFLEGDERWRPLLATAAADDTNIQ